MFKLDNQYDNLSYSSISYISFLILTYFSQWLFTDAQFKLFSLHEINAWNLITHQFMHADPLHLIWNLLLIYIFTSCLNKIFPYGTNIILLIILGIVAGLGHHYLRGTEAIGASGGTYGLMGLTLIIFGKNKLHISDQIRVPLYWPILILLTYNIILILFLKNEFSQYGHFSGFISGVIFGIIILFFRKDPPKEEKPLFKV